MIRVAIVDDQEILRQGMKMILSTQEDMEIAGEGSNGTEGYRLCEAHAVDVILMDIKMPVMDGVEATRRIKRDFPNTKVIILTTFDEDEFIFEGLKNGASGYLLKDASPDSIIEAIRNVHGGGAQIQPRVAARVVDRLRELNGCEGEKDPRIGSLTERERDIVQLVGQGKNNREIADELFITEGTAKNHISNILVKLELRDRTQLAIFAVKNRLI
ncbi:MAG: Two-component transcriptional response regulator, LuxR family [Firmicutes bacterium]|nr:Two-component transcriptional response regulator, LuxR family [Bacillota bacterium]MDI6707099.1 response regulator transcription factor [Bacillota bacterium]